MPIWSLLVTDVLRRAHTRGGAPSRLWGGLGGVEEHHGASDDPPSGSPPALLQKAGGVHTPCVPRRVPGPRLTSRIPKGQKPKDQGQGQLRSTVRITRTAHSWYKSITLAISNVFAPLERLKRLASCQHRLLRPAPHDHDQLGPAPSLSRLLVHGLAPPASGDRTTASSRPPYLSPILLPSGWGQQAPDTCVRDRDQVPRACRPAGPHRRRMAAHGGGRRSVPAPSRL